MKFKKVAILTSEESWFVPYAKVLVEIFKKRGIESKLFFNHREISGNHEVVFILSYARLVDGEFLSKHAHNVVVHGSDLPKGRGWAPLFWQILEGKSRIPIVLFEAVEKLDEGVIYLEDIIIFKNDELNDEIREKQAQKTIELCLRFLDEYKGLVPRKQKGKPSYYRKRTPLDSELDVNKTLGEQINLLRIVNNKKFPAFFCYKGQKYILKIHRGKNENKNRQ